MPGILIRTIGFFPTRRSRSFRLRSRISIASPSAGIWVSSVRCRTRLRLSTTTTRPAATLGRKLFLRHERCHSPRCPGEHRWNSPGMRHEDIFTSVILLASGWRTICLPEPLSIGVALTNLAALIKQRTRWCHGNLKMFLKRGPLRCAGLTLFQRWAFSSPHWVAGNLLRSFTRWRQGWHGFRSTSFHRAAAGRLVPADNVFCHHLCRRLVVSARRGPPGPQASAQSFQRIYRPPNGTGDWRRPGARWDGRSPPP